MFDGPWESCMLVRGLSPSECASWVQAWGTVAAIVVTVLVATRSYRKAAKDQRKREMQDRAERNRTIANLFAAAAPIYQKVVEIECDMSVDRETNWPPDASLQRYLTYKSQPGGMERDLFAIETYVSAIRRIDVAALADSEASEALISGLFAVEKLAAHLRLMKATLDTRDSRPHFVFGGVADAEQAVRKARHVFEERGG